MRIALGSDHRGVKLKAALIEFLGGRDIAGVDCGPPTEDSCDYSDYAAAVADKVQAGEVDLGIVICGSGIGISMAANKCRGIRAALAYNAEVAAFARKHNNANVLALGADWTSEDEARERVAAWLDAEFEGGRHGRRVDKLDALLGRG